MPDINPPPALPMLPTREDLLPPPITSPWELTKFVWRARRYARLYWRLLRDKRVPRSGRWAMICAGLLAFVYLLWPIDAIPALLFPIIGAADDFVLCAFFLRQGLKTLIQKTPLDVFNDHVARIWPPPPLLPASEKQQPDQK